MQKDIDMKNENLDLTTLLPLNYKGTHADHLQSPTTFECYDADYSHQNKNTRANGEPQIKINKKLKFATTELEYCQLNMKIFATHIRNKYIDDRETQVLFFKLHELIIQPNILQFINMTPLQIETFIINLK